MENESGEGEAREGEVENESGEGEAGEGEVENGSGEGEAGEGEVENESGEGEAEGEAGEAEGETEEEEEEVGEEDRTGVRSDIVSIGVESMEGSLAGVLRYFVNTSCTDSLSVKASSSSLAGMRGCDR